MLRAWSAGDSVAGERLIGSVYGELRRQAARCLRRERRDHTLRPTALVHEAYMRLAAQHGWANRAQFFAMAASMMRRILVDHARRRAASKRAGSYTRVELDDGIAASPPADVDLLALEQALSELALLDLPKARLMASRTSWSASPRRSCSRRAGPPIRATWPSPAARARRSAGRSC
jgi:RNA polymerase sigma factor (TIGR02999 family)